MDVTPRCRKTNKINMVVACLSLVRRSEARPQNSARSDGPKLQARLQVRVGGSRLWSLEDIVRIVDEWDAKQESK